jgi:hypothetical protein
VALILLVAVGGFLYIKNQDKKKDKDKITPASPNYTVVREQPVATCPPNMNLNPDDGLCYETPAGIKETDSDTINGDGGWGNGDDWEDDGEDGSDECGPNAKMENGICVDTTDYSDYTPECDEGYKLNAKGDECIEECKNGHPLKNNAYVLSSNHIGSGFMGVCKRS